MFVDFLQPADAQDNSNMQAFSYSTKSCAFHRFTSTLAGFCKQKHSPKTITQYDSTVYIGIAMVYQH